MGRGVGRAPEVQRAIRGAAGCIHHTAGVAGDVVAQDGVAGTAGDVDAGASHRADREAAHRHRAAAKRDRVAASRLDRRQALVERAASGFWRLSALLRKVAVADDHIAASRRQPNAIGDAGVTCTLTTGALIGLPASAMIAPLASVKLFAATA